MRCLENFVPQIDVDAALRLEIDVEEDLEFTSVWLTATVFLAIWKLRVDKSRVQIYEVRAQLEAKVNLSKYT